MRACGEEFEIRQMLEFGAGFVARGDEGCFELMIAVVRDFTAVSRAILISRSASISPSAVFGCAIVMPESSWRAAFSASIVSLLPDMRRSPRRGGR